MDDRVRAILRRVATEWSNADTPEARKEAADEFDRWAGFDSVIGHRAWRTARVASTFRMEEAIRSFLS